MKSRKNIVLATAALAGLVAGTTQRLSAQDAPKDDSKITKKAGKHASKMEKHGCKGENSCKGKGGCKTGDNGCKGKNSCKGKGGCATDGSGDKK